MKKLSVIIGIILIATQFLGAVEERIEKSFNVNKGGTLYIDSQSGSIKVLPQNKDEVDVLIIFESKMGSLNKLRQDIKELNLKIGKDGDDVHILLEREDDSFFSSWWKKFNVKFEISVPKKYDVDLKTSGGSITVGDLDGTVLSKTSGGSLKFGKITGKVEGKTSGGSIRLEGCQGPVNVKTSGGSITIGEVMGTVNAHTSGGSISVEEVMGAIKAYTSGGSVNANITKQPKNDCELKTSGGSINVHLTEDIQVDVDAKTSGGRIRTDFPVMMQGEISNNSLNAEINGGGPMLLLRTSGGGISIKKIQ
ncbi:DUF4097 domain-containing protein [bacterium]